MSSQARPRRRWTKEEDQILRQETDRQLSQGALKDWSTIAAKVPDRTNKDCRKRWGKVGGNVIKGPWSNAEDKRLTNAVKKHGYRWAEVAESVGTRYSDQCATRWQHFLDPKIDHSEWTIEMDRRLLTAVENFGRNWKTIGEAEFDGRSTTDIKNRYTILDRRRQQNLSSLESEPSTFKANNIVPTFSLADKSSNNDPESTKGLLDDALVNSEDMGPCMGTYPFNHSFPSTASSIPQAPCPLAGQDENSYDLANSEGQNNILPYNPDGILHQALPMRNPLDDISLEVDPMWAPMQTKPQNVKAFPSMYSPMGVKPTQNIQPMQNGGKARDLDGRQDEVPSHVSRSQDLTLPEPGATRGNTLVLEEIQADTLNDIMGTLLKSKSKVKMRLYSS